MRYAMYAPVAVLGLGVLLISGMREQHAMASRAPMNDITRTFDSLEGRDMIVPEEERKVAGMSDYMMRVYGPDSLPAFTTYVGYYEKQVQGTAIHSPKNCLPGAGWEILNSAHVPLPGGNAGQVVNRVMLANKGTRALVYYWYQGRGRITASEYAVKLHLLSDAARAGRTEEALVRIVVPLVRDSTNVDMGKVAEQRADSVAKAVAAQLAVEVQRVLPVAPGE